MNSRDDIYFAAILSVGACFALFLSYAIYRSYAKFITAFDYLKAKDKEHPVSYVDAIHEKPREKWPRIKMPRAKWIIGWFIPFVSTGLLLIFAVVGWFHPPRSIEKGKIDELASSTITNFQSIAGIKGRLDDMSHQLERLRAIEAEVEGIKAKLNQNLTNTADLEALKRDLGKPKNALE